MVDQIIGDSLAQAQERFPQKKKEWMNELWFCLVPKRFWYCSILFLFDKHYPIIV
jgi:hypothetical protein